MSHALFELLLFLCALTALAVPVAKLTVWALDDDARTGARGLVDRATAAVGGRAALAEMTWPVYAAAMVVFNVIGLLFVYAVQRTQGSLPLNPNGLPSVGPDLALNTATSFASNTNWQSYGGETTMSHLTQMLALTSQNFVSAATGIAVLAAIVRGFGRKESPTIGSFWRDLVRSTVFLLLPLSVVTAVILSASGVPQTLAGSLAIVPLEAAADGAPSTPQSIAVGPIASQVAIKQLGTNGGGYYNVNSAHPLENPTPFSNAVELLSILLVPAALCFAFGSWVRDHRQGWAVYAIMVIVFIPAVVLTTWAELRPNPGFPASVESRPSPGTLGGNMEGKEVRFGPAESALWAVATTAASNGSVNSMHDSYSPLGGLVPMLMMQLSEVIFGGVGSGLYGLLAFVIVAVFAGGLMVGRTPEYLGKKIEPFEMKMVSLIILIPPLAVLIGIAVGVTAPSGSVSFSNPGAHAFSQILYAYTSMGNNNGSAFAGFTANIPLHNLLGAAVMFVSRFWLAVPMLAIAGSVAEKKTVPPTSGTLPTHTPLFVGFVIAVILIVGALTYFPALALGPIVEELTY